MQFDLFGAQASAGDVAATYQPFAQGTPTQSNELANEAASVGRAEPADVAEAGGIADAGEELVANRRNRGRRALTWDDIADQNDALKIRDVVKANIWLKPDYDALIEAGMQPVVAHVVKQVYDSVAAKPVVSTAAGDIDAALGQYIAALQRVERGLMAWAQDPQAVSAWAAQNARAAGGMLGARISVVDLAPNTGLIERVYAGGWKAHRDEVRLVGGNKLLGALQPGYDEIRRAMKAIDAGWPSKREAWEVQGFKVIDRPEPHVGKGFNGRFVLSLGDYLLDSYPTPEEAHAAASEVKPFVLVGKRGFVGSFESGEAAIAAAKVRSRSGKGGADAIGEKGATVERAERIGPSRRMPGEDISSERLMAEFGLRGVNFGNWMKTPAARAEAQLHLNHAFDAMHDLAEILGLPPKAMSLGGMLGLAFGAQGHGGRNAAHFVPGVNEINLTRTAGAGALSHEWAHALDHYFARQAGLEGSSEPYLSEHVQLGATKTRHELIDGKYALVRTSRFGEVRSEITSAFAGIQQRMAKRLQTPEEALSEDSAYLQRLEKNVSGWLSSIRLDFKGLEPQFDELAQRVCAAGSSVEKVAIGPTTLVHPAVAEMRELYKAKHGRVYSLDQLRGLQSNVDSLTFRREKAEHQTAMAADDKPELRKVSTEYARNAAHLDNEKGGKPYWSTTCEMFARAFDAFVADKLEARNAVNSYLSFGVHERETVPTGAERESINAAFDVVVDQINVRESAVGPALFSTAMSAAARMPENEIRTEIHRLRGQWRNMPPVNVVATTAQLPFKSPENADGAYHDGQVYVVAGNIGDLKQLQKVMAHEVVMHHSLEQMLGNYGFSKLHHGLQSLKAKGDHTVCSIAGNVRSRYGELPPEIETKEIVARAGEKCLDELGNVRVEFGFMKGVFAGVSCWLRDHGISVPFTNVELQGILHSAGQWAKGRQEAGVNRSSMSVGQRVGSYVGKILGVADNAVTQRVGRGGETVVHSKSDLSRPVEVGEVAEIHYRDGRGQVSDVDRGISRDGR